MSAEAEAPALQNSSALSSPRTWVGVLFGLAFLVSLGVGLLTITGAAITIGVWKGGVDQRISAVETASKEMVQGLEAATTKRLDAIDRDRKERIEDANRWRDEQGKLTAELKTISTNQQRQIDILTDQSRRTSTRP